MGRAEDVTQAGAAEEVQRGDPRSFEREVIRDLNAQVNDFIRIRPAGAEADGRNGVTEQWIAHETAGGQTVDYRVVIKEETRREGRRELVTRTTDTGLIQYERKMGILGGGVQLLSVTEFSKGGHSVKKSLVLDIDVFGDSIMNYRSDQGGRGGAGERFFIRTTRRGPELATHHDPDHGRPLTAEDKRKVKALVNMRRRVPGARIRTSLVPPRS